MKPSMIKLIGFIAAALGCAAGAVSDWAAEKRTEQLIDERISEALADKEDEEKNEE